MEDHNNIVFFDGVCNLCNGAVDFLIRKDKKRVLKFSSLQSNAAKRLLDVPPEELLDTIVFLSDRNQFYRAKAVAKILIKIGGFYSFIGYFINIFPSWFSDIFYKLIAKNRYRFFGKKDTCRIPTNEEAFLFIEQ